MTASPARESWIETARSCAPLPIVAVGFLLGTLGTIDTVLGHLSAPLADWWRAATDWSIERNAWLWIGWSLIFASSVFVSCVNLVRQRTGELDRERELLHANDIMIEVKDASFEDGSGIFIRTVTSGAPASVSDTLIRFDLLVTNPSPMPAEVDCTLAMDGAVHEMSAPRAVRISVPAHTAGKLAVAQLWLPNGLERAMRAAGGAAAARLRCTDAFNAGKPAVEAGVGESVRL